MTVRKFIYSQLRASGQTADDSTILEETRSLGLAVGEQFGIGGTFVGRTTVGHFIRKMEEAIAAPPLSDESVKRIQDAVTAHKKGG